MSESKFSVIHVAIIILMSVFVTFGICRKVMTNRMNFLNEEMRKQKEMNKDYSDLLRANEDAAYHYEREYILERDRARKLEEQLKKCCPNYKIED